MSPEVAEMTDSVAARGFGTRLRAATAARGAVCVGIDPHPQLLQAWGLPVNAEGLARFAEICVAAFGDLAAIVKPQVAFFEAYGSAGFAVLERTIADLRAAGALVLADAKRGDIGSTMAAYAHAWLHPDSPLRADAVTVSPYLGFGALDPALTLAAQQDAAVFVLAATSNPEGASVQHARVASGQRSLRQDIVDRAGAHNAGLGDVHGTVGVVVGATLTDAPDLSRLDGPVLMPGVGAQGGTALAVRQLCGSALRDALPSVSREILAAGPSVSELRAATSRCVEEFAFIIDA